MSIRARITAIAALVVAVVLGVAAVALVEVQQRVLRAGIDDALIQRADDLEALIAADALPPSLASRDDEDALAQLVDVNGDVIVASPRAVDVGPLGPVVARQRLVTTSLPVDNEPFRLLSRPVMVDRTAAVLHVAAITEPLVESRIALQGALLVGVPLVVAVLAAVVYVLVGRTLRPVADIAEEVTRITADDLDRRVPEPATHDEIGRLARLMNQMLDRLDAAARRQRRLTSDAAHELRSPLARIRTELEVDAAHPETADPQRSAEVVLRETETMQALVEDLLALARHDEQAEPPHIAPTDLADVVQAAATAARDDVQVTVDRQPVVAPVDEAQLTRAVRNLVDNAVRHARSRVEVTVGPDGDGWAQVTVTDDGPGIPPDARERVFERFARLDEARTRGDGGTGLGLAITRAIVNAHGGSVQVDPAHRHGARLVVRLPTLNTP